MGKVYFLEPFGEQEFHWSPLGRKLHIFSGGLAAKFTKDSEDSIIFERECKIWLELQHRHIVPLLSLKEIGGVMAALMPRYHECSGVNPK
jgi:hypothetical protein